MDGVSRKIQNTVEWLKTQTEKSGTKGLILGISGGIDSALCSFLIKQAFPNNSLGLIMPCGSNPIDKKDALLVAQACGIESLEIELTDIHRSLFSTIEGRLRNSNNECLNLSLSNANLKARLRMSTLYSMANALNYLVVGTDNAAELYTGYYTKYGDGGVDILPIGRLLKREVRQWSKEIGVPEEIIDKAPSAGLWLEQTDEAELGTTYEIIDNFLEGEEIPLKDQVIIERLHKNSQHKRETPTLPPKF